jgi:predicted O-linked N-acetylglucosamine transferase (SPINDLY family)
MNTSSSAVDALFAQAVALYSAGRLRDAWIECGRIASIDPDYPRALHLGGVILLDSGQVAAAGTQLERALSIDPTAAGAWLDLARVLDQMSRPGDALSARRRALAQAPNDPEVVTNASAGLLASGDVAAAVETADMACRLAPQYASAWFNLALALQAAHRADDASKAGANALRLSPDDPRMIGLAAQLDAQTGNLAAARDRLVEAVARFPQDTALSTELGYVASRLGDSELAATAYEAVLAADPDNGSALSQLLFADKQRAHWDRLPELQGRFAAGVAARRPWLTPFSLLSDPSTRAEQWLCAETWGRGFLPPVAPVTEAMPEQTSLRQRIAYLSGDFYQHPTAALLAGVLEHHDRTRFEVFAYSTGPDDGSAMRRRIVAAVEHFSDVAALDAKALASRIRADRIDVLVDLKGYTEGAPLAALALRPAPVQAHWLGYPGTLAAPYIDYLIADQVVVPPAHQGDYGEAIAWLPGSYQPNDRSREAAQAPSRASLGLPAAATVLCAFNALWKINPAVFDAWAEILRGVPNTVLWLLAADPDDAAVHALRRAAADRGIDAARLCFATRRPVADYLALYRHADLFLDTWPYNAHTTASDALWMGVPVVTWLGETFAGRVAASLLGALGMSDLVAPNVAGYIKLATALAADPARVGALRQRIEAARYTAPLFDARATARAVENAYRTMIGQRRSGQRASFLVSAG